jgi:hypothetical protein
MRAPSETRPNTEDVLNLLATTARRDRGKHRVFCNIVRRVYSLQIHQEFEFSGVFSISYSGPDLSTEHCVAVRKGPYCHAYPNGGGQTRNHQDGVLVC